VTGESEAARPGRLRVVIAEDSVLLLAGLTKLLEAAGFEVAATAADAGGLLAAVERERPDVVIADVRMPPSHTDEGIRAALVIRGQWPDIAILVLSQYVEERYAADLLSANTRGVGYLLKDRVADVAEFLDALRRVAAGGTALDPEVVAQLLVRRGGDPLEHLTQRERDVLALMAEGRSNAEIAAALVITDSAVSKHINSIFAKLGLYPGDVGHRRVLAVLRYLGGGPQTAAPRPLRHNRHIRNAAGAQAQPVPAVTGPPHRPGKAGAGTRRSSSGPSPTSGTPGHSPVVSRQNIPRYSLRAGSLGGSGKRAPRLLAGCPAGPSRRRRGRWRR
jgi:DNA-binding NarL/FixJ family response regulator